MNYLIQRHLILINFKQSYITLQPRLDYEPKYHYIEPTKTEEHAHPLHN